MDRRTFVKYAPDGRVAVVQYRLTSPINPNEWEEISGHKLERQILNRPQDFFKEESHIKEKADTSIDIDNSILIADSKDEITLSLKGIDTTKETIVTVNGVDHVVPAGEDTLTISTSKTGLLSFNIKSPHLKPVTINPTVMAVDSNDTRAKEKLDEIALRRNIKSTP